MADAAVGTNTPSLAAQFAAPSTLQPPQSQHGGGEFLRPVSLTQMASCVQDDVLLTEYNILVKEDPQFYYHVFESVWAADQKLAAEAEEEAERLRREEGIIPLEDDGAVGRRAPMNPFHSPKLGKYRVGDKTTKKKDPALNNNPIYGRLLVTTNVNMALVFVFFQVLVYEWFKYGTGFAPGSTLGPQGITLVEFGGLDTNEIRDGQTFRVFWAMWMHSGFLHIGFNVLCQLQFFFMLEPDWGFWRTFFLFFTAGVTGNIVSAICDPCSVTVGSSGGLYGLMGAMIPYCIEFWKSIPRPLCILIFSIVVIIVSVIQGFIVYGTDNWAHLGGLIGGVLFGLMTITTLSVFNWDLPSKKELAAMGDIADSGVVVDPKGRVRKKVVKRTKFTHFCKEKCACTTCKCGIREWSVRIAAGVVLFAVWLTCWLLLLEHYTTYQPPGFVSFKGTSNCVCCWDDPTLVDRRYLCFLGELKPISSQTWEDHCADQTSTAPRLLEDMSQWTGTNDAYSSVIDNYRPDLPITILAG